MRRLTYAPKAYVYVRSRNHQNKIFDLSDYVVSGTVDRVVNDVSKASVVLRNAFMQFSPEKKDSFFLPMDGITIWLQRLKNQPIQVFTGYLDSVPFYQMYPGNCQITASCTLKRLLHTYFDPTIQATATFFTQFGWVPDFQGGYSNPAQVIGKDDKGRSVTADGFTVDGVSNDAGIGQIIKPFLMNLGGWNGNHVWVADLPGDLPKKAAKLYDNILAENSAMLGGLEEFLKAMMTVSTDPGASTSQTVVQLGVMKPICDTASDKGVNPVIMTLAALLFSGLDTAHIGPNGEVGLFACPNKHAATKATTAASNNTADKPGFDNFSTEDFFSTPAYNASGKNYGGYTAKEMMDPKTSVTEFAHRMILADPDKAFAKQANKGNLLAITEWISKAANVPIADIASRVKNQFKTAQHFVAAYSGAKMQKDNPLLEGVAVNMLPDGLTWQDSDKMFTGDSFNDKPTWTTYYKNTNDSLAPFAYVAHKSGLRLVEPPKMLQGQNDVICLQDPSPRQENADKSSQFWGWLKSQNVDIAHWTPTDAKDSWVAEYQNGRPVSSGTKEDWPKGMIIIKTGKNTSYPRWTGNPATSLKNNNATSQGSPTDSSSDGTTAAEAKAYQEATFEDITTMSFQAAFYAQTSFPGNQTLSSILQGDKALMNDIPIMEGVKQLCGGSMRSFMSMPNGDFVAFYPDYFGGSNRKPYWAITDMEIVSLGIQLTDEALATHVYVTGATQVLPGQIDNLLDSVSTLGVVTLQHVFGDGNFISGDIKGNTSGDILGRSMEAYKFLKFYGARPLSINQPLIRNHMFEFLYAWQTFMLMWAKQFQTMCEFTFQPEMLAGGRVAFPDHGLEMYIDSVHHAWSYESGFKTSAVLMAPTTTIKDPSDRNYRPGMALAGNNLSGIGTAGG